MFSSSVVPKVIRYFEICSQFHSANNNITKRLPLHLKENSFVTQLPGIPVR